MVKNTQTGNIDKKTGLVKSGKNQIRQGQIKRQKSFKRYLYRALESNSYSK